MSNAKEFLKFTEAFLHGSGLWPSSPTYRKIICYCLLIPMSLIVDFFVLYGFHFTNLNDQITKTADLLESTSGFAQLFVRKFILIVHWREIQDVFYEGKQFWDYDTFGEDFGNYLRHKMRLAINVIKSLLVLGCVLIIVLCSAAIVGGKETPLRSWTFENNHLNWGLFVMQTISFIETCYLVGAVDALYVLSCTELKVQFLLLRKKMKTIKFGLKYEKECFRDLVSCVNHHQLLMRIHKKVNMIFSEYFCMQYVVSVAGVCVQFYILQYLNPVFEDVLRSFFFLAAVFLQVAMFFMPASDIQEESEKFATEIYNTNWERTSNRRIRKQVLFMMMKAQEPLVMLGGGMLHVNRREYILLFRLAFSMSTLLGGMNDKL